MNARLEKAICCLLAVIIVVAIGAIALPGSINDGADAVADTLAGGESAQNNYFASNGESSEIEANLVKIGDVEYATLAEAVKAVAKGTEGNTVITLLADQTITNVMVGHTYAQDITIDLNGHTLSAPNIALTAYRSGTTLTIKNGTVVGNSSSGTLRATYGGKLVLGDDLTVKGAGGSATLVYVDNGEVYVEAKEGVQFVGGKYDFKVSDNANNVMNAEASIDRNYYATIEEAFAVAGESDVVALNKDLYLNAEDLEVLDGEYYSFFIIDAQKLTVDLNGHAITADVSGATLDNFIVGVFATTGGAELTINDSVGSGKVVGVSGVDQNDAFLVPEKGNVDYNYKFYTLVANYDDDCNITINGGSFELDYAGDSLVYTSSNEGVTVNGGSFILGNLGGIRNGMPWIFNARGQNTRHVVVNGGSFCTDILHQYYPFEVNMSETLALKHDNGMYTVVPAVAYVTEREWSSAWYTNNVGYATLAEAIAACEGPKTAWNNRVSTQEMVVLLTDIELDAPITVEASAKVAIDLNGKTVSQIKTCSESYAMITNKGELTIKDSLGGGKVVFTDIGEGDASFGWGSYTINNSGKLVISGAQIINESKQNGNGSVKHMYCAIQQNGDNASTLIRSGLVSAPTYRSIRINRGSLTVLDGHIEGQIWAQPFADGVSITVEGGYLAPRGVDSSSIYIDNSKYAVSLSVSGGEFATKIGCSNPEGLKDSITGGSFTQSALDNTNALLFAPNMKKVG